jgi:hypothetical protein
MATIKIKIRRKPLRENFTNIFEEAFPLPKKKIKIHKDFGILTACSKNLFIGLQMLLTSIAHYYDVRVLVWDVGMSPEQVKWCHKQPKVCVMPFKHPYYRDHITYAGAWFKPHYMSSSPFKHTIWIDSDAMVVGDLRELIDWAHPNALFTSDYTQLQESTLNLPSLYSYLPIGKPYFHDILPYINSGVLITHKKRDAVILEDWRYCVEQACTVREIADSVACWDQGALKWALHKNDLLYLIVPDKKFNYPAKIRHFAYPSTSDAVSYWIKTIKPTEPCVILHWMGSPKPWGNWGDFIGLDIS